MAAHSTLAMSLRFEAKTLPGAPVFKQSAGWRVAFSKDPKTGICVFSVQLVPAGRGSTEADWAWLGGMCAAMKMPPNALEHIKRQAAQAPNAVLKTVWSEE